MTRAEKRTPKRQQVIFCDRESALAGDFPDSREVIGRGGKENFTFRVETQRPGVFIVQGEIRPVPKIVDTRDMNGLRAVSPREGFRFGAVSE